MYLLCRSVYSDPMPMKYFWVICLFYYWFVKVLFIFWLSALWVFRNLNCHHRHHHHRHHQLPGDRSPGSVWPEKDIFSSFSSFIWGLQCWLWGEILPSTRFLEFSVSFAFCPLLPKWQDINIHLPSILILLYHSFMAFTLGHFNFLFTTLL